MTDTSRENLADYPDLYKVTWRTAAFAAFDAKGDTSIMEIIIGQALSSSYHKRLAYLEGKSIITLGEHAKAAKLSHSNLINKAKRQTIEAFWETGAWKIGV